MKLSDKTCKTAKAKEKPYKLFDGGGLFLEVLPTGKKLWRLKYRHLGKESRISFGPYPLVTLAEAREEREKAKKLLLQDVSPSQAKKSRKAELSREAESMLGDAVNASVSEQSGYFQIELKGTQK